MSAAISAIGLAVGIDLGGTNARVALVSAPGKIERIAKVKLTDRSPQAVADLLAQQVSTLLREVGLEALPVGVGMAAQMLRGTGRVALAPNLGWRDVPFAAMLHERLGVTPLVTLVNFCGHNSKKSRSTVSCKSLECNAATPFTLALPTDAKYAIRT